jgi:hypothetical protein
MWWVAAAAWASEEPGCTKTSIGKLSKVDRPAVMVLGERKGTLPDLARARRLVNRLAKRGPVTVAIQAVRADKQDVLDRYTRGEVTIDALPAALDWSTANGFPFEAYEPLLSTARDGVRVAAIGIDYALRPQDEPIALPPGYIHLLTDGMGDSPVPVELEAKFVDFVAWADHRLASAAVSAWDGQGVLVLVVDRFHVEGGMGVQWQAKTLTEVPVRAALLADADGRCYAGDETLR